MQSLIPNTSAKTLHASNFHTALGKPPSSCSSVTCKSLFKLATPKYLLTCRPFFGAILFGVEGMSQPSSCHLLLGTSWAQKNWNILKKKSGKKKSMWRNWIINSWSRNAWLVTTVRPPSSGASGCELKGPTAISESVLAFFITIFKILFSKNIR